MIMTGKNRSPDASCILFFEAGNAWYLRLPNLFLLAKINGTALSSKRDDFHETSTFGDMCSGHTHRECINGFSKNTAMPARAMLLSACLAAAVTGASATLGCAGGMGAFQTDNRPDGWVDTDQRFAVWQESDGHHHILCESGVVSGKVTRTTVEQMRSELGLKTGWQSANPDGEIRVRV